MERNDIYEIVHHGQKLGLPMAMATCGYKINAESIARLKKLGVSTLSFSLDGATPEKHDLLRQTNGSFDTIIKAAGIARKAGMRFQINTTISKLNINEFAAIAELAQNLDADCFNPFVFVPTGRGKQISEAVLDPVEYELLLHKLMEIKKESKLKLRVTCSPQFDKLLLQEEVPKTGSANGCMGGREFGFISCRGDVQTCGFMEISAGNMVESGFDFAKIWLESELLNQIRNRDNYSGKCGVCEFLDVCGGCRARAYAMTGDYLATDPICNYQPKTKGIN